ncbi:hypothetical protein Scep_010293 [Stephania cephalantha]|uniref:Uncharacterized protein n=1 Tax=Stephania cephalantha TaxID=152367 RepID=A0AAP0JX84_9MAGN
MPPFEGLYGRACRSLACWAALEDTSAIEPEVVVDHTEKARQIKQKLQAVQDKQKKYADKYLEAELRGWGLGVFECFALEGSSEV